MNERIGKLAEQAKKYALDAMIKITDKEQALKVYSETYDTKFAELIVAECVMKLKETKKVELPFIQAVNEHAQELPLSVYIAELKEHFGVEE
jgi:hypothetical protein